MAMTLQQKRLIKQAYHELNQIEVLLKSAFARIEERKFKKAA